MRLFPAYAGVILLPFAGGVRFFTFPRLRGGDPVLLVGMRGAMNFSPPTRG